MKASIEPKKPHLPVGGRLRFFKNEWYKHTSDPKILDMISDMHIELDDLPPQRRPPPALKLSYEETIATKEQIKSLLEKKAIVHTAPGQEGEFFSSVFLRPKKDGGQRMILNLKQFNKFMHKIHFKMETLQHIFSLISEVATWQFLI